MADLLFIEIGAVVTEILGPTRCTIEPFCDPENPPTYTPEARVEVDHELSLASVLGDRAPEESVGAAVQRALYDPTVGPDSVPIGPSWPGGGYEGVATIREDVVKANATLAAAAATLPGHPWEYQVVASIDEETGAVRRYHGFHAEVVNDEGGALVLQVASAGTSADPSWRDTAPQVPYEPGDAATFYTGALVEESVIRSGWAPGSAGAVFITFEAAGTLGLAVPKLPTGAGL